MSVGQRIKEARKNAGLTQKELAGKLGVAYQTLAQWENDLRNPKLGTLYRISAALEVPVSKFLTPDEEAEIESVIDILRPGNDETNLDLFRRSLVEETLYFRPIVAAGTAREVADAAILKAFEGVSDKDIRKWSIDMIDHMNRLGRIETLQLIEALSEVSRYKDKKESPGEEPEH